MEGRRGEKGEGQGDRVKAKQYWGVGIFSCILLEQNSGGKATGGREKSTSACESINTSLSSFAVLQIQGRQDDLGGKKGR